MYSVGRPLGCREGLRHKHVSDGLKLFVTIQIEIAVRPNLIMIYEWKKFKKKLKYTVY